MSKFLQKSLRHALAEINWWNGPQIKELLKIMDRKNAEKKYRLPKFATPEAYEIYLKPFLENSTFYGKVSIDIRIKAPTYKIVLNAQDLHIDEIIIDDDKIKVASFACEEEEQTLTINFDALLEASRKIRLSIVYRGYLKEDLKGFYKSYYVDAKGNKRYFNNNNAIQSLKKFLFE